MEFSPGDYVWLYTTNLPLLPGLSCKLAALWISQYKVTAKFSTMAYSLNLPPGLVIHDIFHASLLKLHYGSVPSCPAFIIIANINAAEYEVEV